MCFTLSAPSAYSSILPSPKLVNTSFAMFHCMPGDDLPVPASGDKHTLLFPESFFFFLTRETGSSFRQFKHCPMGGNFIHHSDYLLSLCYLNSFFIILF